MDHKVHTVRQQLTAAITLLNGVSVHGYQNLTSLSKAIKILDDVRTFTGNAFQNKEPDVACEQRDIVFTNNDE